MRLRIADCGLRIGLKESEIRNPKAGRDAGETLITPVLTAVEDTLQFVPLCASSTERVRSRLPCSARSPACALRNPGRISYVPGRDTRRRVSAAGPGATLTALQAPG